MRPGTLIIIGVLAALSGSVQDVTAQSEIALHTNKGQLRELAQSLRERYAEDRRLAMLAAQRAGFPMRRQLPNGRLLELQRIAPGIGPVFYITNNVDAADTVSTDELWPGGGAGLALEGAGFTLGQWDGGAVQLTHTDLAGRVNQVDGVTEVSGHSTHVAGTLIGAGQHPFYPQARGMAYAANLDAYDWVDDAPEMALAASNDMLISNHSYGLAAGWLYLGDVPPDTWWWIGGEDPSDVEDANFGYYSTEAAEWDGIAQNAPYYLIVKAAGNDRWDTGPLDGEEYTVIDQDGNFLFTSTLPRNPDCAPLGYDCLPGKSVAKNVLTVGAADDLNDGYAPLAGPGQVQMTGFSGWGPTDDGRIKPDLVGNGMWLVSTWPDAPGYAAALGTSMAAPNITGSLLLLQEHYEDTHGSFMRAATLKALAIHTADEAGNSDGPDYAFGWGLLNSQKAADVITENGGAHRIFESSLLNGAIDPVEISITEPDAVVKATLVWSDPPATPVAPSLDPPDLMLVNDLDLRLTRGQSVWLPWILDPANPSAAADRGDNFRDNVEQVVAQVADTGSYFMQVSHEGALQNGAAQDYSLIISILPPPPAGAVSAIDEDFTGGMLPPGWTVETVRGVPWTIQTPVPGDPYLDNVTGGTGQFAMVNNNFARTDTSLKTPVLDLSSATDVVLSFNSNFLFSDLESVNVDVSTDSGGTWSNVWRKQGLIGFPQYYVEDLSAELAGQANAMLRFRYETFFEPAGYYWQIDNVMLDTYGNGGGGSPPEGDPPAATSDMFPANGEVDVSVDTVINWSAGDGAETHDVHFGTTSPPPFILNQGGTGFNPGPLAHGTTYYWRVDEVNDAGKTTGFTSSFTTIAGTPQPVTTVHLETIDGFSTINRNRWFATVNVSVADSEGSPVTGVLMEGSWSGVSGETSCTTGGSGQCAVTSASLKSNVASVAFTVDSLSGANIDYDPLPDTPGNPVTVFRDAPPADAPPTATVDTFDAVKNAGFSGNVLDNDDRGQPEATVSPNNLVTAQGVALYVAPDGGFSYTPPTDFVGADSFSYTIVNSEGSDSAQATINVADTPAGGTLTLTATGRRDRGAWYVDLSWSDGSGTGAVDITRNLVLIASGEANDGSYADSVGKKLEPSYTYEVCEDDTGDCASATVTF